MFISSCPSNDPSIDKEDELIHNTFKTKSTVDPKITEPFLDAFFVLVKEEIEEYTPRNHR